MIYTLMKKKIQREGLTEANKDFARCVPPRRQNHSGTV